jgi:hypothetical protein
MVMLLPETCWSNKTAYFVTSSWFFILHYVYYARSHEHQSEAMHVERNTEARTSNGYYYGTAVNVIQQTLVLRD